MAIYNSANNSYQSFNKTLFEAVVLADQFGNMVGPANPSGMAVDAFGRARMSQPFTLYDSFHRYQDNNKAGTANNAGGTYSHNANSSVVSLTVDTASGSYVKRESTKVFAYQPGKSLQVMQTYIPSAPKPNLRQRIGYFGEQNGIYLEINGTEIAFVVRSFSSGVVTYNRVLKENWNVDKLDGTGPSNLTIDITKAQIMFIDVEWLGLGTVRCGFVINGQLVHCHSFHHANIITDSYMTTGCLPVRAEIENTGITSSPSTFKIVCTTVISEGGYELRGKNRVVGDQINQQKRLNTAGTYYPVQAIKLHSDRMDAIVIPKDIDVLPVNNGNYRYEIIVNGTLNGAVWANTYSDSSVQYNTNASATVSGGTVIASGYVAATTQARTNINLPADGYFNLQLERNTFANTQQTFILAIASDTNSCNVCSAISWIEVT